MTGPGNNGKNGSRDVDDVSWAVGIFFLFLFILSLLTKSSVLINDYDDGRYHHHHHPTTTIAPPTTTAEMESD
jgi:hypothetical protein